MKSFCRIVLSGLLLSGLFREANAQSALVTRLRTVLRDYGGRPDFAPDSAYVDTLNRLAYAYYGISADSAFFYARTALENADSLHYLNGQGESWRILGNTYEMIGDYANMLSSYHHSLDIGERTGKTELVAKATGNIALYYKQVGEYDQARILMERVRELYRHGGDSLQSAMISTDLADLAYHQGQYGLALEHAQRALNTARRVKDEQVIATSNNDVGRILVAEGYPRQALPYYLSSLDYFRQTGHKLGIVKTTTLLAGAYLQLKDYGKALPYALQSLEIARALERRMPESQESAKVLSDIYAAKGDDRNALLYYKLYKDFSDSLFNDQSRKQMLALAARYEYEKKETQLKEEEAKKETQHQHVLHNDAVEITIAVCLIVALSGLAFILLRRRAINRQTEQLLREKNEKIEEQKETLEHQAVQLLLNNQQKDKLFSIIAHDLRGPLNSLKGLMDFLKEKRLSEPEIISMLEELRRNVDYSSELVGNLLFWASSQLNGIVVTPVILDLTGLVRKTLALFSGTAKEKNVYLGEELPDTLEGYADLDMIQVVIRNLVSNAIKFCRSGDHVTIRSFSRPGEIEVCVADTGIGIKGEVLERIRRKESLTSYGTAKEKGTGLGMLLCREFTEINKGQFRVESEWGKGTYCYFTIPSAAMAPARLVEETTKGLGGNEGSAR